MIQTDAYISTATEAQLRAAGKNYPSWTRQYTAMNDDASRGVETIRTLAQQWTVGISDPYDQAMAIEQQLRNPALFQYTLNPPQDPNLSVWPVVYFLTISHKGYCQYFASAMGSMLRSLGIPTRLVSGYGPGTARAQSGRAGERQEEVTTSDAHSWVEAYFPSYGWIPFEPTPPSTLGDYQPFPRGTQAATQQYSAAGADREAGADGQARQRRGQQPSGDAECQDRQHGSRGGGDLARGPRGCRRADRRRTPLDAAPALAGGGVAGRRDARPHRGGGPPKSRDPRAFAARLARARPQAGSALGELATVTARAEFSEAGTSGPERSQALRTWRRALLQATFRPRRSPG